MALAFLVIAHGVASADTGAPVALDVKTFAQRFESDSPRLRAIAAEVDLGGADITRASLLPNPSIAFDRQEVFTDDGGLPENAITLGWALDLSGRRSRRVAAARNRVDADRARAGDLERAVLTRAIAGFYEVAHARLRLGALRRGRAPLSRMVSAVRRRVTAGDAAGYDLARLELELAAYEQRIAEAATALRTGQQTLAGMLGDHTGRYDADDGLELPARPGGVAPMVPAALASRGDYRATALDTSSAAAALSAARRSWIPLVNLELGLKTIDLGAETATGYVATIGIELPLFDRGQPEIERARARQRVARWRRAELERAVPTDVRVARERLIAALDLATRFRTEQLDRADTLVDKAESIYQAGEGSVVELVDAYRTALDTRLQYLALRAKARSAELALSLALGRRPEALRTKP